MAPVFDGEKPRWNLLSKTQPTGFTLNRGLNKNQAPQTTNPNRDAPRKILQHIFIETEDPEFGDFQWLDPSELMLGIHTNTSIAVVISWKFENFFCRSLKPEAKKIDPGFKKPPSCFPWDGRLGVPFLKVSNLFPSLAVPEKIPRVESLGCQNASTGGSCQPCSLACLSCDADACIHCQEMERVFGHRFWGWFFYHRRKKTGYRLSGLKGLKGVLEKTHSAS